MINGKYGFALIGYGGMGRWHTQMLKDLTDIIHICGIYDIDTQKSEAAEKDGFHAYGSLDELLQDGTVDFVTVAIPNDVHKDVCISVMNAGKNVICEKPVALNSDELQQMIDAANRNGVLFSVHQNRRRDEDFLSAKKIIDDNMLGKVFNVESRVHGSRGVPGDWRNQKQHGGGMVLDWGVHLLDQMLMIFDKKVVSVYATLNHVTNDEVDDGFKTILTFEDGMTAHVEVGTSNFISYPRWYILGENGSAEIDWGVKGKIVMVSDWENRDAVPVVTAAGLTKTMAPRTDDTIKEYPLPVIKADCKDYYRNYVKAMKGEEPLLVTHEQVMRVMKLMEAVFESGETNNVVKAII